MKCAIVFFGCLFLIGLTAETSNACRILDRVQARREARQEFRQARRAHAAANCARAALIVIPQPACAAGVCVPAR